MTVNTSLADSMQHKTVSSSSGGETFSLSGIGHRYSGAIQSVVVFTCLDLVESEQGSTGLKIEWKINLLHHSYINFWTWGDMSEALLPAFEIFFSLPDQMLSLAMLEEKLNARDLLGKKLGKNLGWCILYNQAPKIVDHHFSHCGWRPFVIY